MPLTLGPGASCRARGSPETRDPSPGLSSGSRAVFGSCCRKRGRHLPPVSAGNSPVSALHGRTPCPWGSQEAEPAWSVLTFCPIFVSNKQDPLLPPPFFKNDFVVDLSEPWLVCVPGIITCKNCRRLTLFPLLPGKRLLDFGVGAVTPGAEGAQPEPGLGATGCSF